MRIPPKAYGKPDLIGTYLMNTLFPPEGRYRRIIAWRIWAARHRDCPQCGAEATYPCLNLLGLRRKPPQHFPTRVPHDARIDWEKLAHGLLERGYIGHDVYDMTIRSMKGIG